MSNPDEFQRYAEECQRLVEDGDVGAHRASLETMAQKTLGKKTMAQTWRRLAVEEENIADLVREVDNLFSTPSAALDLALGREAAGKPARRPH